MKEWKKPQLIVMVRNVQKNVLTACKDGDCAHSVQDVDGGCAWVREPDYDQVAS